MNTTSDIPSIGPHRAHYRTVLTEVQRSTVGGGWSTVAVAEDPDWAASISAALDWLEHSPVWSDAV